jgi:hypothetical protein
MPDLPELRPEDERPLMAGREASPAPDAGAASSSSSADRAAAPAPQAQPSASAEPGAGAPEASTRPAEEPAEAGEALGYRALAALRRAFRWPAAAAAAEGADPEGAGAIPVLFERLGACGLEIECAGSSGGASGAAPKPAPVCLICLEPLLSEDFAAGRAIALGCDCRGDLALRHRECAVRWAQVKDGGRGGVPTCELCQRPARNLPALPPRPPLPPHVEVAIAEELYAGDASQLADFAPSTADLVFDCVRVTWVAMIVSILFFEASLGSALWTGLVAGLAYSAMVRLMYRQHFQALRAYAAAQAEARAGGAQVDVHVV